MEETPHPPVAVGEFGQKKVDVIQRLIDLDTTARRHHALWEELYFVSVHSGIFEDKYKHLQARLLDRRRYWQSIYEYTGRLIAARQTCPNREKLLSAIVYRAAANDKCVCNSFLMDPQMVPPVGELEELMALSCTGESARVEDPSK